MLDWQDLVGRSNVRDIVDYWARLPRRSDDGVDQDTFLWANQSTLCPDTTLRIYRDTEGARAIREVEIQCDVLIQKEKIALEEERKKINGFIQKLDQWEDTKRFMESNYQVLQERFEQEKQANEDLVSRYERQIKELIEHNDKVKKMASNWLAMKALSKELFSDSK